MPKPFKPLLIIFSILIFAGIFALSWNQWLRPPADGTPSGAGQASQSAQTGSGQAATAQSGVASNAPDQSTESATSQEPSVSSATGGQPVTAANEAGAKGDEVAVLPPDAAAAPGDAAQPSFDIVRVEPSGDTVVAGRAEPNSTVELLSNGSVIATTAADAGGEFVLVLEQPLAAGGHDLALRTSGSDGVSIYSKSNVAVAVPEVPSGEVLVVMNEPGAASEILAKPDEAASAAPGTEVTATGETVIAVAPSADGQDARSSETQIAAATEQAAEPAPTGEPTASGSAQQPAQPQMAGTASDDKPAEGAADQVAGNGQAAAEVASAPPVPLAVEAVEVESGKLFAAGTAKPGETIRVYIDGEPTGETTALDNGRWLLETEAKVAAGTVIVRADQLAPGRTNVVARAEVPFTKQVDMAVLIPTAAGGAAAGASVAGELPKPNSVIIRRGDNLWTISRRTYGHGIRYTTIYTANKDQIRNPHRIYPGQVFMLPVADKGWTQ
jgi:nucleoid-associated protein YgaU